MKRTIRRLDSTGDTAISFDLETGENLDAARALINSVKGARLVTGKSGGELRPITNLMEADEEVLLLPAIIGG